METCTDLIGYSVLDREEAYRWLPSKTTGQALCVAP